jgi:SAM-dependent methyltransferase
MPRVEPLHLPSFRDPAGRLVVAEGRILRWISHGHRSEFEAFLASSVAQECAKASQIISYRILEPSEARELTERYDLTESGALAQDDLVLEHERVPFPSFPYEWPPEMLEAAGRLTLDLAENLLNDGLGFKDATPYNVLFRGTEPVFIDVLSIERRDARDPLWLPYAQFVRTFLLPLVLNQRFGIPLESLLLGRRDGIEPEEAYQICGPLAKLRPPILTLATIPTWLGSRQADAKFYRTRRVRKTEQARFILKGILGGLRRQLERLKASGKESSRWSNYIQSRESYTPQQFDQKKQFIDQVLSKYQSRRLLDAGCNTGQFSLQAARAGASVVAIDSDQAVVGRLWRLARAEGLDILPLVVNLARPSPAVGWRNGECSAFLDRAKGGFDMVFFLALLHHLLIAERIPLVEVINLVADLTTDLAVIEYVGTADPMFQRLLRGRGALYEQLNTDAFEAAVRTQFHIVQSQQLTGSCRQLYLLKKLSGSNTETMRYPRQKEFAG